jgi:class 3 adenylate cyclase
MSRAVDSLARQHTERAIDTIVEVMNDPFAENKDRLKAADSILDRGHGKPLTATIALPSNTAHRAMLAALSDEELMERIQGASLPRLAPIEAQFSEVVPGRHKDPLLS